MYADEFPPVPSPDFTLSSYDVQTLWVYIVVHPEESAVNRQVFHSEDWHSRGL